MLDQPLTTGPGGGAQLLETLSPIQSDSLLALIAMAEADKRPEKIDVGVGVYRDGQGRTPILRAVKAAEKLLWDAIRGGRVDGHRFRRQQVILGFVVDFYCHAARLVVEVDGPVHDQTIEADAAKDHILATQDIRVLRFRNHQIINGLPYVLDRLRHCLLLRDNPSIEAPPL